jgi:NADPH2:quinone reductase
MIGTVGSEEKADLAKAHGCTHTINYKKENIVERVKEITGGKGVPVAYDSVGKDTLSHRLIACLRWA